jgi:DNA-binding SARP family transcriptional activator
MGRLKALPPASAREEVRLHLLGGFELSVAQRAMPLPEAARRLIAILALRGPTPRSIVAGMLWPDGDEATVLARLRTAVWRANAMVPNLIVTRDRLLDVTPDVAVDVRAVVRRCSQILAAGRAAPDDVTDRDVAGIAGHELLPEWDEDWVVEEREYLRQVQVHALEALAAAFLSRGWYAASLDSAMRAVQMDPIRETAHRAVIAVHLAESNVAEAARHYGRLRSLLERELGVAPSPDLIALMDTAVDLRARVPTR